MVAKASGNTNGGEQSGPLPLPINHWELEIRLLDDLVSPAGHVGVSVEHSAANVSSKTGLIMNMKDKVIMCNLPSWSSHIF